MAEISAKLVKELRDQTGAGMMDCKKALKETSGDLTKATEWLRQKGIASAEKKAGRTAAEGAVGSYIHTGARVGVLVEVNCETDFVARGDAFQELVRNVAMQIAACPNVEFVTTDDIPDDVKERETSIEMGRDDLGNKPEAMKAKIVEGRVNKRLKELALLEQPFIKDSSLSVADRVKQLAGKIGENIQVRRFTRYTLGEGMEVKEEDVAAEVAAMTAGAPRRGQPLNRRVENSTRWMPSVNGLPSSSTAWCRIISSNSAMSCRTSCCRRSFTSAPSSSPRPSTPWLKASAR